MRTEFVGKCCRVDLNIGSDNNQHIMFSAGGSQIYSTAWLDELIDLLLEARAYCETQEPVLVNGEQFGWRAVKRRRPKKQIKRF